MASERHADADNSAEDAGFTGDLLHADDATLALALKAGDSRAPRVCWMRFGPMVYRILRRTFGPQYDIEDVQQDVFLAFFRKVPGLREPGALKPFLMSITARNIKYQLRRAKARRIVRFWESTEEMEAPQTEPSDMNDRKTLQAFYSVLETLNARDRTLFALRFLDGMDLARSAAALGVSVSTAKRHLTRIWKLVAMRVRHDPFLAADYPNPGGPIAAPAERTVERPSFSC